MLSQNSPIESPVIYSTKAAYFVDFQRRLQEAQETHIVSSSADFIQHLMPTLIFARKSGAWIRFSYFPPSDAEAPRLLSLLDALGCDIHVAENRSIPPIEGAFFDPLNANSAAALIQVTHLDRHGIKGKTYSAPVDRAIIRAVYEGAVLPLLPQAGPNVELSIVRCEVDHIIERLKTRHSYKEATFELAEVKHSAIKPQNQRIRRFKLNQAHLLRRELYKELGNPFYCPLKVSTRDGRCTYVIPPVLEMDGNTFGIAEGHSRIYASREAGEKKVLALVARGVTDPLPGGKRGWNDVNVTDEDVEVHASPDLLQFVRKIESCTHLTSDWQAQSQ